MDESQFGQYRVIGTFTLQSWCPHLHCDGCSFLLNEGVLSAAQRTADASIGANQFTRRSTEVSQDSVSEVGKA